MSVAHQLSGHHELRLFRLVMRGQGRGRTVDLPIFRSWVTSSPKTVNVRDLR
jgi:hypothetical protein